MFDRTRLTRRQLVGAIAAGAAAGPGVRALATAFSNGGSFMIAPGDLKAVLSGNARFALDLYGKLRTGPGNLFFSPFSLTSALAMTSAGAKGETAGEMAKTLHLPEGEAAHAGFRTLNTSINGSGDEPTRPYQLLTANALWAQKGDHFLPEFLKIARESYDASLQEVDFKADAEAARTAINTWVEAKTRDKIKDLIARSALSPATSLVLTNAIYFKADWRDPFPEAMSHQNETFTTGEGKKIPVVMMRHLTPMTYGYFDGGTFQMLELPYAGGTLAMDIVLPKTADGLHAVESTLSPSNLTEWTGKISPQSVQVELPKYRLDASYEMSKPLADLGMVLPFDASKADFSGMTGRRGLSISAVVHKAFVDVSEKGTEAAAATGVLMTRSAVMIRPKFVTFRADHPFLFLIRDLKTGSILFLGRLSEPKAAG